MKQKLWNMYKETSRGKEAIAAFNVKSEDFDVMNMLELMRRSDKALDPGDSFYWTCSTIENFIADKYFEILDGSMSRENFEAFIDAIAFRQTEEIDGYISLTDKIIAPADKFREKIKFADCLSLALYIYYDEFFKPIFFLGRFDLIQSYAEAIDLELPLIPNSKDYKKYFMYYYDMCKAIKDYQDEYSLTDAEMCACLYDFAQMNINETSEEKELPRPTNVWLTGASGKGDFDFLDSLGKDESYNPTHMWSSNERTHKGDIVVVYCTSPRSYIHSIWQATTEGVFNPFNYYQCRTTIDKGVRIPEISFHDLKNDPYMSQVPIVRRNLQGIKGIELTAKDYSELLRMIEEKGGDTSKLPKLLEGTEVDFGELKVEKDVEENILIPILKELGYDESDWTRQLELKAGRKEKAIPDFVFLPRGEHHFETAPMVIEAKFDMSRVVEQKNAFTQGMSYAKMLRSSIMGICDKERLLLYRTKKDGSIDRNSPIFEEHWSVIYTDGNVKARLNQLIGKNVVSKM